MSYRDSGPGEPQDQNDNWRGGGNFGGGGSGGGAGGGSGLGRDNWSPGEVGGRWSPAGYLRGGFGRPKSGVPPINWDDPNIKWTPVDTYDPLSSIRAPTNWDDPNIHWSPVGGNGIDQNVNKNNQGDPNHTADPGRMGPMAALPPALTPAPPPAPVHPAYRAFNNFFSGGSQPRKATPPFSRSLGRQNEGFFGSRQ
jgi:hypothetical protein